MNNMSIGLNLFIISIGGNMLISYRNLFECRKLKSLFRRIENWRAYHVIVYNNILSL